MKKISVTFVLIAVIALFYADIEIVTLSPMKELGAMLKGAVTPQVSIIPRVIVPLLNTLIFAFCGITLGFAGGSVLAQLYRYRIFRYGITMLRSIHEIFWAFILMPLVGLNAICGVLAIAIPYSAIFAKRLYEIYDETDKRPYVVLPQNASKMSRLFYGAFPLMSKEVQEFTSYRFECAFRSSAILGFIGLPTIGYHLESYFKEGYYSPAFALLFMFYIIIGTKKHWMKAKAIPFYIVLSFLFVSKEVHILRDNMVRFFTNDIIPWPMRRTGFIEGTGQLEWAPEATLKWVETIWQKELKTGIFNTVIITQLSFVFTGIIAILLLFYMNRRSSGLIVRKCTSFVVLVLRTTPEYITAYLAILLWGPSMLPGIVALVLHNAAVVTLLTMKSVEQLQLPTRTSKGKINRYFFYILPQVYGAFLGNLFYRWEVMVRESAILGVLGIYTLGYYIDSAIADDKMDKAVVIIAAMAIMNIVIDSISQRVRKAIRI